MAVKVMKVKKDKNAAKVMERMLADGWSVQSHNVRKAKWSFMAGLFTRKQIHTMTFVRDDDFKTPVIETPTLEARGTVEDRVERDAQRSARLEARSI